MRMMKKICLVAGCLATLLGSEANADILGYPWGGLMFMFSRGKPDGISKAKSILTGAVVGLLIVLFAWLIVNTAVTVLGITGFVGGFGTNTCTNVPSSQINVPSSQNSP